MLSFTSESGCEDLRQRVQHNFVRYESRFNFKDAEIEVTNDERSMTE